MTKAEETVNQQPWQLRAASKRERCHARIPAPWRLSDSFKRSIGACDATSATNLLELNAIARSGILSAQELNITQNTRSASDLLAQLRTGAVTAERVTVAFSKRAAVAGQLVGRCLVGFTSESGRVADHPSAHRHRA